LFSDDLRAEIHTLCSGPLTSLRIYNPRIDSVLQVPCLKRLPDLLPLDGVVRIELREDVPVFKAPQWVQDRIETLLDKQHSGVLSADEARELDSYEELDDYLGFVNRVVRNATQSQQTPLASS